MGTIPSGVPLGLSGNIKLEFGPISGVTPDNLLGFVGRDIGIPTAPQLKFGDFVGKGRHSGREMSMKAFLSGAPFNNYNPNYASYTHTSTRFGYNAGTVGFSNGLLSYSPPKTELGDGAYGWHWGTAYQPFANGARNPFVRSFHGGACGIGTYLNNAISIKNYFVVGQVPGGANTHLMKAEHCTENTVISVCTAEDGSGDSTLYNIGGDSSGNVSATSTAVVNCGTRGKLRAFRTSPSVKFKTMENISIYYSGGGCNGRAVGMWFLLPNKWDISANLGLLSGNVINSVINPWEAVLCVWTTGTDNVGTQRVNNVLKYGNNMELGSVIATSSNWYGGMGYSVFVNWTGSAQTFSFDSGGYHGLTSVHKISFVGDPYTFDLA